MKLAILLCVILSAFITSCTVQKRHYSKGYEITFNKSKSYSTKKEILEPKKTETIPFEESAFFQINNDVILSASIENKKETSILTKKHFPFNSSHNLNPDDTCDMVLLRNGNIINVKILEINPTEVKYKNCNYQDGPLIIIDKNTVKSIAYNNGFTEEFAYTTPIINN